MRIQSSAPCDVRLKSISMYEPMNGHWGRSIEKDKTNVLMIVDDGEVFCRTTSRAVMPTASTPTNCRWPRADAMDRRCDKYN